MNTTNNQSVFLSCGVIHESFFKKIAKLTYPKARKLLKTLWFTKSEQTEVLRTAVEFYEGTEGFKLNKMESESIWKRVDLNL